ncbi:protein tilB homolog isoform X2 [Nilaparvata lugens]|uniref:protein tilB homolog isoform X1 n=1 Tax=Nilaparvata lugens TaxID=108931 RepID=UPI00193E41C1|nr:protein tilB homolog isoform X1 [Nilaparvata lugens]XP_039284214.1 protein tilB homolog isoform X2 [Nilaparvata lugens]
MVRITEELVRKRSEHNEREIGTLEEIALHQEEIEKIEHLQNWCRHLKILLLQSNIISKIENLNKLKKLEYINLALNNIERIENLEGCESLKKLDLTLNFIGDLTSVKSLKNNIHLEFLCLLGNPCTDFKSYRQYVVASLPQLQILDSQEILRSERIKALQLFEDVEKQILDEIDLHNGKREKQRKSYSKEGDQSNKEIDEEGEDKSFWSEKTENTPEARIEIANHIRKSKESKNITEETRQKRVIRLFNKDGIPLNVNEAKIDFRFRDDDFNFYVLELHTYKHLDISFIDIDVQPFYIKVLIKGKVFQLTFDEEIKIAEASAKRSQTSGHLVITMPKMNREVKLLKPKPDPLEFLKESSENNTHSARREYLEIGSSQKDTYLDYTKICKQDDYTLKPLKPSRENVMEEKIPSADFTDNPEVPPLM